MGIKAIDRLIGYSEDLIRAIKSNKKERALKLLTELEKENKEELSLAKEFETKYLLDLHGKIEKAITFLRQNLSSPGVCVEQLRILLMCLKSVLDQRVVRDKLIKEIIAPILKNWGYKKKGRAFIKKERDIVKKINVTSSQSNDYYNVLFIFEITATGPNIDLFAERAEEKWFELTEDADIEKIKIEIREHLTKVIKPFLDKIK
jgi:hypothetical protein